MGGGLNGSGRVTCERPVCGLQIGTLRRRWDAAIIEADRGWSEVVLSENLSDRDCAGVRVENPFLEQWGVDEPQ